MTEPFNKYRAAIDVLQKGRDVLVEQLAEDILGDGDDLAEGGFLFNEFLEAQGTRLHFLGLIVGQLEQSAEAFEESHRAAAGPIPLEPGPDPVDDLLPEPKPAPKRRKSRSKKLQQTSAEGRTDEA